MKTTYEEWREITNQNNKQKSVSISSLLWRLLPLLKLITILHRARVIDATIFVHSINLSSMFLFFLLRLSVQFDLDAAGLLLSVSVRNRDSKSYRRDQVSRMASTTATHGFSLFPSTVPKIAIPNPHKRTPSLHRISTVASPDSVVTNAESVVFKMVSEAFA